MTSHGGGAHVERLSLASRGLVLLTTALHTYVCGKKTHRQFNSQSFEGVHMPIYYISKKQKVWRIENRHRYFSFRDKYGETIGELFASFMEWKDRVFWKRRKTREMEEKVGAITGRAKSDYPEAEE
jgi:hypothetical protein